MRAFSVALCGAMLLLAVDNRVAAAQTATERFPEASATPVPDTTPVRFRVRQTLVQVLAVRAGQETVLGQFTLPAPAQAVELHGSTLLIALLHKGWLILEVGSPESPRLLFHDPEPDLTSLQIVDDHLELYKSNGSIELRSLAMAQKTVGVLDFISPLPATAASHRRRDQPSQARANRAAPGIEAAPGQPKPESDGAKAERATETDTEVVQLYCRQPELLTGLQDRKKDGEWMPLKSLSPQKVTLSKNGVYDVLGNFPTGELDMRDEPFRSWLIRPGFRTRRTAGIAVSVAGAGSALVGIVLMFSAVAVSVRNATNPRYQDPTPGQGDPEIRTLLTGAGIVGGIGLAGLAIGLPIWLTSGTSVTPLDR